MDMDIDANGSLISRLGFDMEIVCDVFLTIFSASFTSDE